MTVQEMTRDQIWALIHAERAALATDLTGVDAAGWATPSLCGAWTVEETVAHLTAGCVETRWRWMRSVLATRFDFDLHNERRLREQLGATPTATLQRFTDNLHRSTAPSGHHWAWLGEVVIHAEDIRRPLGHISPTPVEVTTYLATKFVANNFAVPSKNHAAGLRLIGDDSELAVGDGPHVSGPTLSLLMAISGRTRHLEDLAGPGVEALRGQLPTG